jgi:hypothetical protein
MAVVPAIFAVMYARETLTTAAPEGAHPTLRQAFQDFRSLGAVMFALLLFFQFGNEMSIAGWLPLLLIRRIGLSPEAALIMDWPSIGWRSWADAWCRPPSCRTCAMAACCWERSGGAIRLPHSLFHQQRIRRRHGSAVSGSWIRQRLSARVRSHRPPFSLLSSRIFQWHLLLRPGGRPAGSGHVRLRRLGWGVGVVVGIPLAGTCMVMVLILLIWLESKVTGEDEAGVRRVAGAVGRALALAASLTAASLPESIETLLASSPSARTAFWGIRIVDLGQRQDALRAECRITSSSRRRTPSFSPPPWRLPPGAGLHLPDAGDGGPAGRTPRARIPAPLRLVGGGDPNLSARAIPYRRGRSTGDPLAALEDWPTRWRRTA